MAEKSKFSSMLNCKCPRCQEGDVFVNTTWSRKYTEMHKNCPKCGLRYEYELGFFWGAMYIGYALSVAISVTLGVATYVLLDNPDTWVYLSIIITGILLSSRINFRYARMILLYMFAPKFESPSETLRREKELHK